MFDSYELGELTQDNLKSTIDYHMAKFSHAMKSIRRSVYNHAYPLYHDMPTYADMQVTEILVPERSQPSYIATQYDARERFKHGMVSIAANLMYSDTIIEYLARYQAIEILRYESVLVITDGRHGDGPVKRYANDFLRQISLKYKVSPHDTDRYMHNLLCSTKMFEHHHSFVGMRAQFKHRDIRLIIFDNCEFIPSNCSGSQYFQVLEFLSHFPNALIVCLNRNVGGFRWDYTLERMVHNSFFRNSTADKDDLWKNDIEEEEYDEAH